MTQKAVSGRVLAAGIAASVSLAMLAGAAEAQQAYYFPQAGNGPVTVNYNALTPYSGPYAAPGYQAYGAPAYGAAYGTPAYGAPVSQPRSVFTPQAAAPGYGVPAYPAPAYGAPVYGTPVYGTPAYQPVYATPSSQFLPGQVTSGPAGRPASVITYNAPIPQAPFVAPYANPYGAQQAGLVPAAPYSYLNVPGAAPAALIGSPQPGAKPYDPNFLKKAKRKAAAPAASIDTSSTSAVEEAAAAQVAAVEAQLESTPAAPPTPPAAPEQIPAQVPSPTDSAEGAAAAAAPAPAASEPVPADTATIEPPAEGESQSAAIEPAAETPAEDEATEGAGDNAAAALPAGAARLVFEPGADELPAGASGDLDAIAQRMMADESMKVQVLAYSSISGDNESQARRKALSRGLEVRKYLINQGVRSNRIDVRALGSKSEGGPADRVDIVPGAG